MSADLDAIALRETLLTADGKGKAAKEHALQSLLNAACSEAIAQDRKARELRAEDGLRQIDEIAHEIISNPGLEKNTVDLVSEMVMWFKTYKQQLAQQSAALAVCKDVLDAAKRWHQGDKWRTSTEGTEAK